MEKVVLTKEQFEAIKWLQGEEYTFDDILNGHSYWSAENTACLNVLKVSEMAKILYTGNYEIEKPKFQPGDKVIVTWVQGEPTFHEVQKFENDRVYINTKPPQVYNPNPPTRIVRLATPEEIYWLDELKRNSIPDFRKHDIYVDGDMDAWLLGVDITVDKAHAIYQTGDFLGVYPIDSFKPFPQEESK